MHKFDLQTNTHKTKLFCINTDFSLNFPDECFFYSFFGTAKIIGPPVHLVLLPSYFPDDVMLLVFGDAI